MSETCAVVRLWIMQFVFLLLVGGCVVACGTLWYKKGAGAEDLLVDERACQQGIEQDAGANVLDTCMRAKGWRRSQMTLRGEQTPAQTSSFDADLPVERRTERATVPAASSEIRNDDTQTTVLRAINGWWKRGATPNHLQVDQQRCQLDLASPPDDLWDTNPKYVQCMSDLGWQPL